MQLITVNWRTTLKLSASWERLCDTLFASVSHPVIIHAINPIANMLSDFLTTRKRLKKEMFALPDKTVRKYFDLDLQQSIEKINANS